MDKNYLISHVKLPDSKVLRQNAHSIFKNSLWKSYESKKAHHPLVSTLDPFSFFPVLPFSVIKWIKSAIFLSCQQPRLLTLSTADFMPKEVINKPPEWLLNQDTGKVSLDLKISVRPWQVATVDWALSVHCSPSVSPGSDNVLCFPTHQSFDSAKIRKQTDS